VISLGTGVLFIWIRPTRPYGSVRRHTVVSLTEYNSGTNQKSPIWS